MNGVELTWTVHLARRAPGRAGGAVGMVLLGAVAAAVGFRNPAAGILTLLLLGASISDYLLPVRYRLDRAGIDARGLLFHRRMRWKEVRQVRRDSLGVKLSPLSRRSRLEAYRGIYLWFGENETEVMEAIARFREEEATGGSDSHVV